MSVSQTLLTRANSQCELCGSSEALNAFAVAPHTDAGDDHNVLACETCSAQLQDGSNLDMKHWFCLQETAWSQVAPVQVVSYRMLHRITSELWASDLLEQLYLEEATLEWAQAGLPEEIEDDRPPAFDSNGAQLFDGDNVTLVKDLDVKGTSFVAKRGTLVRGIRVTDNPIHVEGKVNKIQLVLKTEFLKRAT
ncbi:MAG: protein PhnA [Bradymonadia bacterium]|jgi:protein PhnA